MIKNSFIWGCIFACVFTMSVITHKQARASLMITPILVVFEGRDRYADVTLVNNGDEETNYKMEWVYRRQIPITGAYEALETMGDKFDLSKHIVFSPKRVRLAPKSKQKIRLALRRPEGIAPGDYRVHLMFTALADEQATVDDGEVGGDKKGVGTAVSFSVSYSIPVLLRVGEPDTKAEIGTISLERDDNTGALKAIIPVTRSPESSHSILGHLQVYHVDNNGSEEFVGEIINANVYSEINSRTFKVLLKKDITGGSLRVVVRNVGKEDSFVYAERTFSLE